MDTLQKVLKKLHIEDRGRYDNHFYIINLDNSDDYAKMYTTLSNYAVNTEFPEFEKNSNNATTKVVNYFETEEDSITFDIFLFANFVEDKYYVKIKER